MEFQVFQSITMENVKLKSVYSCLNWKVDMTDFYRKTFTMVSLEFKSLLFNCLIIVILRCIPNLQWEQLYDWTKCVRMIEMIRMIETVTKRNQPRFMTMVINYTIDIINTNFFDYLSCQHYHFICRTRTWFLIFHVLTCILDKETNVSKTFV